jgi:hypothetical protein
MAGGQTLGLTEPRRFYVLRRSDVSGVSGTGRVADGVQFTDGTVVLRWLSEFASTAMYDSIETLEAIHGHGGSSTVHFLD